MASSTVSAFFYGTLMHPKILKRVIGNDGSHLQICPAILLDYTRHQVKDAAYPAIIPYEKSRAVFDHDLETEQRSVRGTLVVGLSQTDISFLDLFEGNEYARELVSVHPIASLIDLSKSSTDDDSAMVPSTPPPLDKFDLSGSIEAYTYVWCSPITLLNATLWSFEQFVKVSAWEWIGSSSAGYSEYSEVDKRREMGGIIFHGAV